MPANPIKDKLAARVAQVRTASSKRGEGGYATTFVYEPTDFLEMDHGSLFITLEVLGGVKEATELGELVTHVIQDEYYRDLNRDPLASFEASLQRLNEELAEFASSGRISWVGKLSAVIAALAGRTLHLTQIGDSHAYLLRGRTLTNISEGLSESKGPNPLKTFLNIASGELGDADRLVLSGPSLFLVASQSELSKLLAELSPARTIDRLRPELESQPGLERLAAILVEVTTEEKRGKQFMETESAEVVLDRAGSGVGLGAAAPAIGKAIGAGLGVGGEATSKLKDARITSGNFVDRLRLRASSSRAQSAHKAPSAKPPAPPPAKTAGAPPERSASAPKRPRPEKSLAGRLPRFPRPRDSRLTYALIALLAASLVALGAQSYQRSQLRVEAAAITRATASEAELKSAVAAGDRARAESLYREALEKLEPALKSKDGSTRSKAEALRAAIQADRDILDAITHLFDPTLVADLAKLGSKVAAIGLVRTGDGSFYSADQKTGAVYKVSGTNSQVLPSSAATQVKGATLGPDNTPVLLLAHGTAEVSDQAVGKPALSIGDWPPAVDIASFANYLYLLDPAAGRVWRIPKSVGGYGKAQDYLGNENDQKISGAKALAIDGSVYILQGSGDIWKFNQGARDPFKLSGLPSPIPETAKLFANAATTKLYALDGGAGRVVIITAAGAYERSIVSDAWKGATGFWVDESGKTLYVLTPTKLYRAPL